MYEFTSRVRYSEIGSDYHMKLSSLIARMQDCCVFHSSHVGFGPDIWISSRCAWLVLAWQVRIHSLHVFETPVTTRTWAYSFRGFEEALQSGAQLKARYGAETVEDLRELDAKTLVNEAYTQHHMTVDGYALVETPNESYRKGVHNEEQILHGYNAEESGPFIIFGHANLKNFEEKVRGYF